MVGPGPRRAVEPRDNLIIIIIIIIIIIVIIIKIIIMIITLYNRTTRTKE